MTKSADSKGSSTIRPVCFMVMPYGTRATDIQDPKVPQSVDFNALYEKALKPAIETAGYTAVRADQETSPLIVVDMLERLTLADLVIADLSINNGNVYYEIGVRHATEKHNCVLVAATWARPLFDLQQIRQGRYPLPAGELKDADYKAAEDAILAAIQQYQDSASPVHRAKRGAERSMAHSTFAELMEQLSEFQSELREMELEPSAAKRKQKVKRLVERHAKQQKDEPMVRSVALELMHAVRDQLDWTDTVEYIKKLPKALRDLPYVREQLHLAESKTGEHLKAIAALERLAKDDGDTSERQGLIGGRYKKLYNESKAAGKPLARHLDKAIEHYERGMLLDLNDYFPSCNLPRLYRTRNKPGDAERATAASHVVVAACERARLRNSTDVWLRPTLLGAAFDAGDVVKARELADDVRQEGATRWRLATTIDDLKRSAEIQPDAETKRALSSVLSQLATVLSDGDE